MRLDVDRPLPRSGPSASVARGAIGLLTTQPFTWAASLVTTALVPHYLGEGGFGQLAVITTITALGGAIASLGMQDYMKRRIAMHPSRVAADASAAILLVSGAAALIAAGLFFVLPLLGSSTAERTALGIALCGMIVQAAQGVVMAVLVGQERHARYAWLNAASVVINAGAGVAVLAAGGGVVGYLATSTIATAILTGIFWRYSEIELVWADWLSTARELFFGGLPFLGWNVARLVRAQIDIVLVGLLLHAQAAGWLAAAYRIIGVVVFFPTVITTPLLPVLSREVGDSATFQRVLRRSTTTVLTFTIPAAGFIIALAPTVPDLLGWAPGFHHAIPLMMILAIQQPLIAVDMVLGTALIALGRERPWLSVMVIAAVFNPGFNLVAIPLADQLFQNGAMGAAVVEVATEMVMLAGALILLPRGMLDRSSASEWIRILLAGALLTLAVVALRDLSLPIAMVVGGLVFLAAAFGLRVLGPTEVVMLRRTVFQSVARHPVG
jgi:O-antigen/teichoic acid export membrane protein